MSVNSSRLGDPTCPATTSPVSSPMPMAIVGSPSPDSSPFSRSTSCTIACAASYARSAWSSIGFGAPNTTSIPSPWNLSMLPPCVRTMSIMRPKYLLRKFTSSCAGVRRHDRLPALHHVVDDCLGAQKMSRLLGVGLAAAHLHRHLVGDRVDQHDEAA